MVPRQELPQGRHVEASSAPLAAGNTATDLRLRRTSISLSGTPARVAGLPAGKAPDNGVVDPSPDRFGRYLSAVLAGGSSAEWFDRSSPRQLAILHESGRYENYTSASTGCAHCTDTGDWLATPETYTECSVRSVMSRVGRRLAKAQGAGVIERYTRKEMGAVWADENRIRKWLDVEIAVCEGWARRGRIPEWAMKSIRAASCDLARMREIERETDHDVIAFLRAIGESVGDAARFIHLGLTSSDVVDTGLGMLTRDAGTLLLDGVDALIEVLARRALEHMRTLTVGRSHGMHAEPTTFGLKIAVWYDELRRHRERLVLALADISVGQVSGAVGTHAHIPPRLESEVCEDLGLGVELMSNQIVQRDRHAFFLSVLAGVGATLEKITVEIRHLQRTEVGEAEEHFGEGNQGSSAMPHKRNPHASERIAGLARVLRGYATTGLENVALWHERDISHSSAERVIFPDSCILVDYMLAETRQLVDELVVYPDRMVANLESSGGLIYSQRVLLALVDSGMDRQEAYRIVQRHAHESWTNGHQFRDVLSLDPIVRERLDDRQIEDIFDPWRQLEHLDALFARVGLLEVAHAAG